MTARTLWTISYSPWSERARWALRHHRVEFVEKQHLPMVGEPMLRWRAKSNRASVPLLMVDGRPTMGSLAIAQYAQQAGSASELIPAEHERAIAQLDLDLEPLMNAARGLVVHAIATDRDASLEGLPRALRSLPFAAQTAAFGARYVGGKYDSKQDGALAMCRDGLLALRQRISGRKYVHDTFTFADVMVATTMQFVTPVPNDVIRLGPATRRAWTNETLGKEFEDLVKWRDVIYAERRPNS